jgi:MFS family permease
MKSPALSESVTDTPASQLKPTNVRYIVLIMVAAASASAYITRYCISAMNTTMQADLGLKDGDMGWIMSIYGIGYLLFQIPGGWLGNRFGTRGALASISVIWSACTLWTASVFGFTGLLCSRVSFGVAQAGLVPISSQGVKDWFPINRRGSASATVTASMSLGSVVALFLTAQLMAYFHWRTILGFYSLFGIAWSIMFYWYYRSDPADHSGVNAAELALIRGDESPVAVKEKAVEASGFAPPHEEPLAADGANPYLASAADQQDEAAMAAAEAEPPFATVVWCLVTSLSLWGICSQVFFRAAGYASLIIWLPAILEKGYLVSKETAGMLAGIVPIGVVIGSMLGGPTIDALLHYTGSKYISRSLLCAFSLTVAAAISLLAAWTTSPYLIVASLGIGVVFWSFGNPATWVATMDVSGKDTAFVMGIMNMAGCVGGVALPIVFGYLIEDIQKTGANWNIVFYIIALIHFLPGLCWLMVNPNHLCTRPRK